MKRSMCVYDDSDGIYEISVNGILEELVYHFIYYGYRFI